MRWLLTNEDKRQGAFADRLQETVDNLVSCRIALPSDFEVDGIRFRSSINWFQYCITRRNAEGEVYLEFAFSEILKPFLLNLREYVKLSTADILAMRSAYTIRMYQIFKAEFDRQAIRRHSAQVSYSLEELKDLLGISDKYQTGDLKDFRDRVLNKIRDEINEFASSIAVEYDYIKTGRRVTGVAFKIFEKLGSDAKNDLKPFKRNLRGEKIPDIAAIFDNNYRPTDKEIETLSRAKLQAYQLLVDYGVYEGIAFKQMLSEIAGSEVDGFEDLFVKNAIYFFEHQTTLDADALLSVKAKTFVVWWHDLKIFETGGEVWAKIMDKLTMQKKKLIAQTPEAYDNRLIARKMTNNEFKKWYAKIQNSK